jgi:hypothetical protein
MAIINNSIKKAAVQMKQMSSASSQSNLKSYKIGFEKIPQSDEKENGESETEEIDLVRFTTYEVGIVLKVSSQTVVNYCKRKIIKCSRLTNTSPRIIMREDLIDFMRSCGLEVPKNFYKIIKERK